MKKNTKITSFVLLILLVLQVIFPIFTNIEISTSHANVGSFDLTVTPNSNGYGSVTLDWIDYNYTDKNFKVYKSVNGGTTYETVGIDYTLVTEVKCLQIYPISNAQNQLKTWMETNKYGKGLIKINSVYIDNFNKNPEGYLKDTNGNYKYDVIFFGTWDSNNHKDLSNASIIAVEKFIKSGRGCIVGHDTIYPRTNFKKLVEYFGIRSASRTYSGNASKPYGEPDKSKYSTVQISKKGILTNYPWEIGDIGKILTVPACHNNQSAENGNIWLRFYLPSYSITDMNSNSNFYLSTKNNCAMIQTGHSSGKATADEQKILANVIFYCNQLIFNKHMTIDSSAQDFASPNAPIVSTSGLNLTWTAIDNGTSYQYYVESYDKNDTTETGLIDRSVTRSLTVTTGVKKYRYIMDDNDSTEITLENGTETETANVPIDTNCKYLHVAAIDGAGNLGPTTHYVIPKTASYTVNYYEMMEDGTYALKDTDMKIADIGSTVTPTIESKEGFITPDTQSKVIMADDSLVIDYYYARNSSTLKIDPNEGLWNNEKRIQEITQLYNTTKSVPIPTRAGYTFVGWERENEYGEMSSLTGEATYTFGKTNDVTDTIIAKWKANPYTLKINPNGGSWRENVKTQQFTIDCGETKTIPTPTRRGYTFDGWIIEGTGSTIENETFTMGTTNATLTAKWKANAYTLTVDPNGGSWEGSTKPQEFTIDYEGTKEIPVPTRNSYHFKKWTIAGEESKITSVAANDAMFTMGCEDATLIAEWELTTHSITGKVIWKDHENQYNSRPTNGVEITLRSDEPMTAQGVLKTPTTKQITSGEYGFENLQTKKEKDNTNYKYTVSQNKIPGYETKIEGYEITNELILPSYTMKVETTPLTNKENQYYKDEPVHIVGMITASANNREKVRLCNEEVSFIIDDGIKMDKNSIQITYIDKDGNTKNITKYTIEDNTIKVAFESNKELGETAGDSIKIEVTGTLEKEKTYNNTISYEGNVKDYETGEDTKIHIGDALLGKGTIEDVKERKHKVIIHLKDAETEDYVEGAVLQIIKKTEKDGKLEEEVMKEWTTGAEEKIYENLPEGDYIIREIKLPENTKGYVKIEDKPIKIEKETEEEKIELKQEFTKVIIKIIDEETKEKIDDLEIEVIEKETGEVIKVKETEEGYELERVPEGDYILREKTPEGYKEVNDIEIKIEGTGKVQIEKIEQRRLIYDMKVEKELKSITINGENKNITKGKIQKIEIKENKIDTEDIKLEYVIRISNTGEVKATIGEIIDNIPDGFKVVSKEWKQEGNQAIWDAKEEELEPGESKEVTIILQWENSASNFGEKKNTAQLKESTNPYHYEDKNTLDDIGEATVVFSIKTGSDEIITILKIVDMILVMGIVMCVVLNRKK